MNTITTKEERDAKIETLGGAHARMAINETGEVFVGRFDESNNEGGEWMPGRVGKWTARNVERFCASHGCNLTSFELEFSGWVKSFAGVASAKRNARQMNSNAWRTANRLEV